MRKDKGESRKSEGLLMALFILLIAFLFVLFVVYIHASWASIVNSDDASELMLAKRLSEEGGVLSKTWFYSSELRVLNTQLIFSPLFSLTDNWHTVRVVGASILVALLALSAALLGRALRLGRAGTALLSLAILTPFSPEYFNFVLLRSYYIPHIAISFVTLAAVFTLQQLWEQKRRRLWLLLNAAVSCLALAAGLGGLRQLLVLYIPLLITALIQAAVEWRPCAAVEERGKLSGWTIRLLGESILLMLLAGIGFLISGHVLRNTYVFSTWHDRLFMSFSLDRLVDVLRGFLDNLNYRSGQELLSPVLIHNVECALIVLSLAIALVDTFRDPSAGREEKTMAAFFLSALAAMGGLYAFSDMVYVGRYVLPVSVLVFPVIVSWLHRKAKGGLLRTERAAIALGLALFLAVGLSGYKTVNRGETSEQEKLAQTLCEQGFRQGYATFWNANLLTELSNGELEMWVWYDQFPEYGDVETIHRWLQSKDHETPPEGELFCVVSADQWEMPAFICLKNSEPLYESDNYRVYRFPSYEAMKDCFTERGGA